MMSGYVALCRPLPGAVVAWFVTGSGISSLRITGSLAMPKLRRGGTMVPRRRSRRWNENRRAAPAGAG